MTLALRFQCALVLACAGAPAAGQQERPDPVRVCATVPDLGSLAQEIGGDLVSVTVFAQGPEDPHFVVARPSFIKAMSRADLYLQVGLELELGWAPALLQNARNAAVLPSGSGYLDVSTGIRPRNVPTTTIDRSMGDLHALGNPHYLLDPINGVRAARMIRNRLQELRPSQEDYFAARFESFHKRIGAALVGAELAELYDVEKLALLQERGRLLTFLESQEDGERLGGWWGAMAPHVGVKVVADHDMWPYFAARMGLSIIGYLEPLPGIPPTTRHLSELIEVMRSQGAKLVLAAAYYNPRHARFVAEKTDAVVAEMAHQVGARPGCADYLATVEYNVQQVLKALGRGE